MSERVKMPALGESVTEGTVTRWLKSVGDSVEVDEPLLEVSTDKVDTEIPSPVAGTLQEILVQEDDTVPVGADLAVVGDASGADGGGTGGEQQGQQAAAAQGPSDAVADPADRDAVAEAGDEGGQEPAEPQAPAEAEAPAEPRHPPRARHRPSSRRPPQHPRRPPTSRRQQTPRGPVARAAARP